MPPPESPRTVSSVSVAGGKDRSAFVPFARWARNFWPAPLGIDGRERLRFIVGAVIGETWKGRDLDTSLDIGKAAFVGRVLGTAAKIIVCTLMVVVAVAALVF